jgi:hypothetical protein
MRTVGKSVLSIIAWMVVMLAVAAALEVSAGRAMPGLVPLLTLVIMIPVLWLIWRQRPSLSKAK